MKWKPLRQIIRMSRYALIGVFLQSLFCSMLIAENSIAQKSIEEIYITLDVEDVSIKQLFKEIEEKTDFEFVYQGKVLKSTDSFSATFRNRSIGDILRYLSAKHRLKFKRVDKNISVIRNINNRINVVEISEKINAQFRVIGNVTADTGEPLPGVSILIKGTSTGTTTDIDGVYNINVNQGDVLQYSYIGYVTQEILVNNQNNIDVVLSADLEQLEEIVVVGYGTAKRKDITGAIVSKNLENSPEANLPTTNVLQNLRGMGGVNVGIQNSPGANPSILVRGQNSINGSNAPLIVLDGIIYLGNLSFINPQDISTIDVLKDASATAVYGSRAANGVIVITTKKGKTGKPIITYSNSVGFNTWQNKFDMMDLERYKEKYAAQQGLASVDDIIFDDETSNEYLAQGIDTDWMDLIS